MTFAEPEPSRRPWWQMQRFPASNHPGPRPRLCVVRDPRKVSPQFNRRGELPALVESGADRCGLRFGDDEHTDRMGTQADLGKRGGMAALRIARQEQKGRKGQNDLPAP